MRLLKEPQIASGVIQHLDLDISLLSDQDIQQHIKDFEPEVIFALSDDENEYVLHSASAHFCHMGFFHPNKQQFNDATLKKADGLAKIFFLKKQHYDIEYFKQYGGVIHQNYLEECTNLVYFLFAIDGDIAT